jgi:flagellar biosynthesis/type III secretory pathway chaperone
MSVWNDFLSILQTENALLQELIELSTAKQKHINDAQEVARLASEEQSILTRLEKVDQERALLFDVVAPGQKLEGWLSTLGDEQQEEVGPLVLDLAQNLGTLQALNDLNQELLAQSLSYVQFSLNLLTGDDQSPTYARPGTGSSGTSIFDRKV